MEKIVVRNVGEANELIASIKTFIGNVLPAVLKMVSDYVSDETFLNGIREADGLLPFRVDLEDLNSPLTAVVFHFTSADDVCLFSIDPEFNGICNDIMMNFVAFSLSDLKNVLTDEETVESAKASMFKRLDNDEIRKLIYVLEDN